MQMTEWSRGKPHFTSQHEFKSIISITLELPTGQRSETYKIIFLYFCETTLSKLYMIVNSLKKYITLEPQL